jgi:hypothetical protein
LQVPLGEIAIDHKPTPLVLDRRRQPNDSRRLEPQKDACRFEHGCFSLRIWTDNEIRSGLELRLERRETAEVTDFERSEHESERRTIRLLRPRRSEVD